MTRAFSAALEKAGRGVSLIVLMDYGNEYGTGKEERDAWCNFWFGGSRHDICHYGFGGLFVL